MTDTQLFTFGRFTDDSQSVLATVLGFADVRSECLAYLRICAVKCRTATLANNQQRIASHNTHFSGTHGYILAPTACANETAPVPVRRSSMFCWSSASSSRTPSTSQWPGSVRCSLHRAGAAWGARRAAKRRAQPSSLRRSN